MGAIQSSVNSMLGTVAGAAVGIKKMAGMPNEIKMKDLALSKQQFAAEGELEDAQNAAKQANTAAKNIDATGKTAKDKTTGKFMSHDTMTQIYHDQERANTALDIAQRNLDAIVSQRADLARRIQRFGGMKK